MIRFLPAWIWAFVSGFIWPSFDLDPFVMNWGNFFFAFLIPIFLIHIFMYMIMD